MTESFLLKIIVWCLLSCVVEHSKLGNELSGVLGSVHGKGLWNNEESLRELSNGELLTGSKSSCEVGEARSASSVLRALLPSVPTVEGSQTPGAEVALPGMC